MKKLSLILAVLLCFSAINISAFELTANNAVLTEMSSGKVLYEKNADDRVSIASVTKVMTVLLAMEAIERGELKYEDMITASEYAASMGGSQIYLEAGEQMTVRDIIKAVMVVSGNDAAVALAEHIGGTYENFVKMMNDRAVKMGLKDTHFMHANGLNDDPENHYSTAREVAIMSAELMKHKDIKDFTLIWMDTLRNGEFNLANTNKLIKTYKGITGLKTGYTTGALNCLSATAERDGMGLCAVVLGVPDTDARFSECAAMLDYGYENFKINGVLDEGSVEGKVKVKRGKKKEVTAVLKTGLTAVTSAKSKAPEKKVELYEKVTAPIKKGDPLGKVSFVDDGKVICTAELVAAEDIERIGFFGIFASFGKAFLGIF